MSASLTEHIAEQGLNHSLREQAHQRRTEKSFPELVWEWLACFRSIQLAITLLALLAISVFVGVMMPQEGLVDPLDIKKQFGPNYRMLKAMGLFNVYSSFWFITLEVLFFFSLLFGSFQWLKPAWLAATRKTFCGPEHILVSPNRFEVASPLAPGQMLKAAAHTLKKRHYTVHWHPEKNRLYACKGNLSRFGPVVAHSGILLLLVASVWGAFAGFKAQELAVPGDTFHLSASTFLRTNTPEPYWQGEIPPWQVRVDDFRIEYYPEHPTTPEQYYADLSLLDADGQVLKTDTISVNHPLSYQDLTVYQASFEPTGKMLVEINGKPKTLTINTRFQDRPVIMTELDKRWTLIAFPFFVQQDPGVTENHMVFFLKDKNGFLGEAPGKMPDNLRLGVGGSGMLGDYRFRFVKPEIATGLQIKKAPEVPLMYFAYLIICTGTVMCIFSQRQIWLAVDATTGKLLAHYKTNKARISFKKELARLKTTLDDLLNPNRTEPEESPA